jgi:preprotein translocase SecE subunit
MAKTRAQRKAEKRRREAQLQREREAGGGAAERDQESQAQHDTQAPVSGDVAEAEAVMRTGADPQDYGEHTVEHEGADGGQARSAAPGVTPEPVAPEQAPSEPAAPAPSRADVGAPDAAPEQPGETREQRRARKKREKEDRKEAREREVQKVQKAQEKPEKKRRGGVFGFLASCWAELKKVQWPDRDTLVQASAVTIIFVAVMAAYLGALDAVFNWLIKQII